MDKQQSYVSPTEADKQMYIFTHWFDFLHLGKRIQEWGHEFEDVMEAYDNWKNCDKSMPQLMGEIQAMTTIKHSSRWYEIQGKNRREFLWSKI